VRERVCERATYGVCASVRMPNLEDIHACSIFFYIFNGVFMFDAAVPVLPGGGAWPFRPFSLSFSSPGAGFSPFWVGASV
jgi:hypothetical protein